MPSLSEEAARRRRRDAYGLSREASLSLSDPQDRPSYSSVASRATDEEEKEDQPATPTRVAFDLDRLGVVTEPSGIFSPNKEEITFHQGEILVPTTPRLSDREVSSTTTKTTLTPDKI